MSGRFGAGRGAGRGGRGGGRKGNPLHTGSASGGRGNSGWVPKKTPAERDEEANVLEASLGYECFTEGPSRLGWLLNMSSVRLHAQ